MKNLAIDIFCYALFGSGALFVLATMLHDIIAGGHL